MGQPRNLRIRTASLSGWLQSGVPHGTGLRGAADGTAHESALSGVNRLRQALTRERIESVMALVAAVEAKDVYTERHSLNVALHTEQLARRLGASATDVEIMTTAALLHDVGKIGVPDAILMKPSRLDADEYEVIKGHPAIGVGILRHAAFLEPELPLVLHHHEWFNGGGYPEGLSGRDIPFGARVLLVADCIDAMLSPRCYQQARTDEQVIDELHKGRGRQFDPDVADVAIAYLADGKVPAYAEPRRPEPVAT